MVKTWLITGSSRGLGRALAEAVLNAGDNLVATARNTSGLEDLADRYPAQVILWPLDVTNYLAAEAAVNAAVERFGRLDVVAKGGLDAYPKAPAARRGGAAPAWKDDKNKVRGIYNRADYWANAYV